ncbi:nucleotidyltransferase domain-containing protein [Tepidimonas sp. HKU77]|uniref:nucleotidyltransferase domain-containing protein n=1 Tax=Tepidimonas sp. HKU77 TaxID=3414503 RepID=UPI003C7B2DBC
MRLAPHHAQRIVDEARALFGPQVQVRLFGSRVDDGARGGDIDLLVTVAQPIAHPALLASRLGARLQAAMSEQRIDVVREAPNLPPLPIRRVAHEQGVLP